ncbi:MAG: co-chaperone GroES, partial [Phycisphaeraceae bacterium]
KVKIRPTGDRIVLQPQEAEATTTSGIVLPDSAQEKPMQGTVVAVGPGRLNDEGERAAPSLAVGDRVVYGRFGGTEIELDGESFMVLRESELLAKIED